tara:strand:+ start:7689 stop:8072 length:384 start_codon:yes stop_codon:yes gene_type:complete
MPFAIWWEIPQLKRLDLLPGSLDFARMKFIWTAVVALVAVGVQAQDGQGQEIKAQGKSKEEKPVVVKTQKKRPIEVGGTLKIIADSDDLISWLDFKKPVDEKKSRALISADSHEEGANMFVLLSVRF